MFAASIVVYDAHGLAWSIVATLATGVYGLACFIDGLIVE